MTDTPRPTEPRPGGYATPPFAGLRQRYIDIIREHRQSEYFDSAVLADTLLAASTPAPAGLDVLRAAVDAWTPQHSSACAAQDEEEDCICGTSAVYEAALAATRPAEDAGAAIRLFERSAGYWHERAETAERTDDGPDNTAGGHEHWGD